MLKHENENGQKSLFFPLHSENRPVDGFIPMYAKHLNKTKQIPTVSITLICSSFLPFYLETYHHYYYLFANSVELPWKWCQLKMPWWEEEGYEQGGGFPQAIHLAAGIKTAFKDRLMG